MRTPVTARRQLPGSRGLRTGLRCVLPAVLLLLAGCASDREQDAIYVERTLTAFGEQVRQQVERTAGEMDRRLATNEVRRRTLHWRIRTADMVQRARNRDNALGGLVELWYSTEVMLAHFRVGRGREWFAEHQERVIEVCERLARQAEVLVQRIVPRERFPALRERVQQAAALGEVFVGEQPPDENALVQILDATRLQTLLALPLAPFAAFKGIGRGGDAAERLAVSAERAVRTFDLYPTVMRWQAQLLLLEAQEQEAPRRLLADVDRLVALADRAVETLPDDLRRQFEALLANTVPVQGEIRATLAQVAATAEAMRGLGDAGSGLLERLAPLMADTPGDAPTQDPLEPDQVVAMLAAGEATARELRGLVAEVGETLATSRLDQRAAAVSRGVEQAVVLITLGAVVVIVAAGLVVAGLVLLIRRLRR